MELRIALQPKQRAFLEAIERTPITFYGGAKGGGKSHGLRNILLLRRFEFPRSIGKLFRRTYQELEDNHITPLFKEFPDLRQFYNEQKKTITLPNHSTLQFCYCKNQQDAEAHAGREAHDLGIEEAGQWPEQMFTTLLGSNRSSDPNIKPRAMLTGNPGGIGHGWLKRVFVERRFNERERPEDYEFIQATVDDNAALMLNDPAYVRRLDLEPNEALRKAYRYGDWSVFAGQFFQEIAKDVHLVKPFEIPSHWNRFGAYDYGFGHPGSFGWYANDEDGNTYKYREFVKAGLRVDQFAKELNRHPDTAKLYPIVAGWDCWSKRSHTINKDEGPPPPTIAEEFQSHGIQLMRANIDRKQGASQMRNYLAWQNKPGNKPKFFIFDTCPITFDTIARMIFDPDDVEDVLKVDASDGDPESGDDAYDETRYGLMSRPTLSDPVKVKLVMGSPAWHAKQNENLFEQALEHFKKQEEGDWPTL